jgi:hypothetical protein
MSISIQIYRLGYVIKGSKRKNSLPYQHLQREVEDVKEVIEIGGKEYTQATILMKQYGISYKCLYT